MKKTISLTLAALLAFSSVASTTALAAEETPSNHVVIKRPLISPKPVISEQEALKSALTVAKSRYTIPAEYSEFTYYRHDAGKNSDSFSLNWQTKDGKNSIQIAVEGNTITRFNKNVSERPAHVGFGKLTKVELTKKASDYMAKLNPHINKTLNLLTDSFNCSLRDNTASFDFTRIANNVDVVWQGGSLTLNSDTGELENYSINYANNAKFKSNKNAIDAKAAEESYKKNIGMEAVYRIATDYDKKTYTPYIVYIPKNSSYIDAFTGKLATFEDSFTDGGDKNENTTEDSAAPGAGSNNIEFTPEELKAIEKNKKLISKEKTAEILKADEFIKMPKNFVVRGAYLYQDSFDSEKFTWSVDYAAPKVDTGVVEDDTAIKEDYTQSIHATIDAVTGNILSFYIYQHEIHFSDSFNKAESDKTVTAAATKYLGTKFSEYKLESSNIDTMTEEINDKKTTYNVGCSYVYNRYVNGLKCIDDTIYFSTNNHNNVTTFRYDYTDVKFPETTNVMKIDTAYSKLFAEMPMVYNYHVNTDAYGATKTALLYAPLYFNMDAVTGYMVDYKGEKIVKEFNKYTEAPKDAKAVKLEEYGIIMTDANGKYNKDAKVTAEQFNEFISFLNGYRPLNYMDRYISVRPVIAENPFITRQDAVKAMVEAIDSTDFLALKGIFKSPFADVSDNDALVGYLAVGKALHIASADKNNKFYPTKGLLVSDAISMAYNYLSKN